MPRKNFGVSTGRPKMPAIAKMPKPAQAAASPMDAFQPAVPAAAFKKGGKVSYHDDPRFCSGGSSTGRK
jgi:hypothetical protein